MAHPNAFSKSIRRSDLALYFIGAIVGTGIVLSNYYGSQLDATKRMDLAENYLERIITRMDAVSGQLSAWGAIDIRQGQGGI